MRTNIPRQIMGFSDFPLVSLLFYRLRKHSCIGKSESICKHVSSGAHITCLCSGSTEETAGADYEIVCALPGQKGIWCIDSAEHAINLMSTCRYQEPCGGGLLTPAHTLVTRRCVNMLFCKRLSPWLLQALTLCCESHLISDCPNAIHTLTFSVSPYRS